MQTSRLSILQTKVCGSFHGHNTTVVLKFIIHTPIVEYILLSYAYLDSLEGRLTDRVSGRQVDRQTDRQSGRQVDRLTDRVSGRQVDRQTDRQLSRQTNKQTD